MIVEDMVSLGLVEDVVSKTDRYQSMVYDLPDGLVDHVESLCLPGPTAFMFSGSWRLRVDATYLELRFFRECNLKWHPNTLFVEPQQSDLYLYTLEKMQKINLVILHSDYWCGHRPVDEIVGDLKRLRSFSSRVICTLPVKHANFNKLTTSIEDLCQCYQGISVFQDSLVMVK